MENIVSMLWFSSFGKIVWLQNIKHHSSSFDALIFELWKNFIVLSDEYKDEYVSMLWFSSFGKILYVQMF